jgi:alpha 1,6-mannosyltransferase
MIILKADLARYLLLNTFGGVYSDVDTKLIRPIGDWADNNDSKVGLMVGIEVDTTRADWKEWYPRSLGFCQWTMASSPGHPVLAKVIYNVIENIQNAKNEIKKEDVVILTGPGVWTDAIMEYLSLQGVEEIQLRNLKEPLLKGDVYVLPITAFSPGVGHMGSQDITDKEARVQHLFEGSWKESK